METTSEDIIDIWVTLCIRKVDEKLEKQDMASLSKVMQGRELQTGYGGDNDGAWGRLPRHVGHYT